MKKTVSLLISLAFILNLPIFTSYAAEDSEDEYGGSAVIFSQGDASWYSETESEFSISTEEQFLGFITLANSGNDFSDKKITLAGNLEFGSAINPITSFNGEFDGGGYTLSNVYISASGNDKSGLFKTLGEDAEVHDFNISGVFAGNNIAAVAGTNNGSVRYVHNLATVQGNALTGGICVENNGEISYSTSNNSVMTAGASSAAGGICAVNGGTISYCENKANISADAFGSGDPASNVGGIAGENGGTIENSDNYSEISGKAYIGGIAGKNTAVINSCCNTGDISSLQSLVGGITGSSSAGALITYAKNSGSITCGTESGSSDLYAGGIAGSVSGTVSHCYNMGSVLSYGKGAGGIAAAGNAEIEYCENYGTVTDTNEKTGGIIGQQNGGSVKYSLNCGNITGYKYVGGIVGDVKASGTLELCGNFGTVAAAAENYNDTNFAGGIAGSTVSVISSCFNLSGNISSRWNCGSIVGSANADELVENSYSAGALKLVGNNKTTVNSYFVPENDASLTDGTLAAKLDEKVWSVKYGGTYPYWYSHYDHASTYAELNALLADEDVEMIVLDADIEEDITLEREIIIEGRGHSVGSITVNGEAVIEDIRVNGSITANDALELVGIITISGSEEQGIIALDDLILYCALDFDNNSIPMIKCEDIDVGADNLYRDGDCYYFNYPIEAADKSSVVVKAENNEGVSYDIYPHISGTNCYFFMPYSADLSNINYTIVHSDDTEEDITVDLSGGKTDTVNIMGIDFSASAMTSGLPVLYLNIDEEYGSIYAMNNSPKHTDTCYGDMRLEIPNETAAANGWESVYTSVGNDKDTDQPGTMELRGRGNSSWSQAIRDNGPRPYQMKLEKKLDIMGMGAAKTYTLLKSDQIQSHNKTLLDMGIDMGLKFTPQSEFVDVYLNGDYVGMYTLAEKVQINEERVNISNLEDEIEDAENNGTSIDDLDITGGYLIEIDNTNETLQFKTHGSRVTIKSPENLDTTVAEGSRYDYIVNLMTDLFDAVYGDGYLTKGEYAGKHFTEVLDMDSVTRYFLHQELTANLDNGLGSTFFYKDKDSIDGKIHMGIVWDNDRACGGSYEGWYVPEINGYGPSGTQADGEDGFFKAMCRHKEFISYILAYYKDNINGNNISETFKAYADIADKNGAYINTAAVMSRLRWNHKWAFTPTKLGTYIRQRAAWADENIDTIAAYGVKGELIDVTSETVETPAPSTPNPNPAVQPEENPHLIAGFRYADGEAGADLDASLGDKTNGYKATAGVRKDSALLFASVNGENTKTLEWTDEAYSDGSDSYIPAVVSASSKNNWGGYYVDIVLSSAECEELYFSAKVGATKKGPAGYKLMYSLDGENYTDVENAVYTLTDNKDMQQAFEYVSLPAEVCGKENVHIRIGAASGLAVNGLPLSDNPSGGEFAVNDIFICDEIPEEPKPDIEVDYAPDAEKINVAVKNNTENIISSDIYTAVYDNNGKLVTVFKDTQDITDIYTASYEYSVNEGETVRVFCWKKDKMIPLI